MKTGKYLGRSVTSEQTARIRDGTFEGLSPGDYWQVGDILYTIGGGNIQLNATTPPLHLEMVSYAKLHSSKEECSK